jgi:hypothetical protein
VGFRSQAVKVNAHAIVAVRSSRGFIVIGGSKWMVLMMHFSCGFSLFRDFVSARRLRDDPAVLYGV